MGLEPCKSLGRFIALAGINMSLPEAILWLRLHAIAMYAASPILGFPSFIIGLYNRSAVLLEHFFHSAAVIPVTRL